VWPACPSWAAKSRMALPEAAREFAKLGVLIHVSGNLSDGSPVQADWKAFAPLKPSADVRLKWELAWVIPSLGFPEKGSQKVWRHLGDNWQRWSLDLGLANLDKKDHMGLSRHALEQKHKQAGQLIDVEALEFAEQEHWVSTSGLLVLLAFLPIRRRVVAAREQADCVGNRFLSMVLHPDDIQELLTMGIPAEAKGVCEQTLAGEGGVCECLQELLRRPGVPDHRSGMPQDFLHKKLVWLARGCPCMGARAWLHRLVSQCAAVIDQCVERWGDKGWHKNPSAFHQSGVKRKRADFHIKQLVLASEVQSGAASSSASAVKSLGSVSASQGIRWRQSEMAAYRAATRLSFQETMQIGVAVDATRLGKPAKELLMGAVTTHSKQLHAVLPPQVLRGTS